MRKQILNRHRQKMVGVHQPAIGSDDPVPVGVRVVAGEDVEVVFVRENGCHGGCRRRIHADLAVPVERHERPARIDGRVDHRQIEIVSLLDQLPVVHARAAQRIGTDADAGLSNRVEVDDFR